MRAVVSARNHACPPVTVWPLASGWSITTLHSQMKYDGGLGLRIMRKRLVGRLDLAYGTEGAGVQLMIGQSF